MTQSTIYWFQNFLSHSAWVSGRAWFPSSSSNQPVAAISYRASFEMDDEPDKLPNTPNESENLLYIRGCVRLSVRLYGRPSVRSAICLSVRPLVYMSVRHVCSHRCVRAFKFLSKGHLPTATKLKRKAMYMCPCKSVGPLAHIFSYMQVKTRLIG